MTTTKRWQARVDWPGVVANYAKGADWVMKQVECRILVGCGNRWGVVANYAQEGVRRDVNNIIKYRILSVVCNYAGICNR